MTHALRAQPFKTTSLHHPKNGFNNYGICLSITVLFQLYWCSSDTNEKALNE